MRNAAVSERTFEPALHVIPRPVTVIDGPMLRLIVTPAEVRERWLTWLRVRNSIALTIAMTALLVAAIRFV
jgi:hypothetical protein